MPIQLQPASNFDIEIITNTFNAAYEGYVMPVNVPPQWMQQNIEKNALQLDLSLVAVKDDKPVGICLVGHRKRIGWIGGVGVALPHRRKGIGWRLMEGAINNARSTNMTTLVLEVITDNDGAYAMYKRLGFETTDKLLLLTREPSPLNSPTPSNMKIETRLFDDIVSCYKKFHIVENPWQRRLQSLQYDREHLTNFVAVKDETVYGYVIARITPSAILIVDTAFKAESDDAIGAILHNLHSTHPEKISRIINIRENDPCTQILQNFGYVESMSQHEMQFKL